MNRSVMRTLGVVIVALVLVATVLVVWSRYEYKRWPWSEYANPLTWCGRRWVPAGTATESHVKSSVPGFHHAGDLPGLLNRGAVWTGSTCRQSGVFVQLRNGRFEVMNLSGNL